MTVIKLIDKPEVHAVLNEGAKLGYNVRSRIPGAWLF